MPCPTDEETKRLVEKQEILASGLEIYDLLETHPFTVGQRHRPQDKAALVAQVKASSETGRDLRALGSVWSVSTVHVGEDVVDTKDLGRHLSQPYPADRPLDPSRLRQGVAEDLLARLCAANAAETAGRHFIFVEAGIKIKQLLADLASCGLALPTMGAGGGQSLAGALSTGTHGADFSVPPLVDWVRAVHLVGPRGQEWWLTPRDSIFAGDEVFAMPGWPDGGRRIADDDAFNAVRVAVGRMGVIYSMILEVVPAYVLVEANLEHDWPAVRFMLAVSGIQDGEQQGIFHAPFTDFDSGWFRDNVVDRVANSVDELLKAQGVDRDTRGRLEGFQAYWGYDPFGVLGLTSDPRKALGISEIADIVRRNPPADLLEPPIDLRHVNIVINLSRPDQCWITRRWALPRSDMKTNIAASEDPRFPEDPVFKAVKANPRTPANILGPLGIKILKQASKTAGSGPHLAAGYYSGADGKAVAIFDFILKTMPAIAATVAQQCGTSGEALVLMLYRLATHRILGFSAGGGILDAVSDVIEANVRTSHVRVGLATEILNVHNDALDHALVGNSAEFMFDASEDRYLRFVDSVVALAKKYDPVFGYKYAPVFGYMGIRFTPISSALIAMQRFDLTVSVEVSIMRVRTDPIYAGFLDELHASAQEHGGIPHWGQEFRQSAEQIAAHYGERLTRWRQMLAELSIDDPHVFSTPFTREYDLEPTEASGTFLYDPLSAFLTGLNTAAD